MKVVIKITRDKTWTDEMPLEFEIMEAFDLWKKLGNLFELEKNASNVKSSPMSLARHAEILGAPMVNR